MAGNGGPKTRGLIQIIVKNFFDSFKVIGKQAERSTGKLVGEDPFGNKYYEIPADPR